MKPFTYERAQLAARGRGRGRRASPGAKFIAGGTNLLDLMKLQIEAPTHLVDVNGLALDRIEPTADGGLRIGALVRNTDLAADARVRRDYGVLSRALLAGASGQLRNKATTAGNLLQRTRCPYFYDTAMPCNKREPGSGCSASAASAASTPSSAPATPASPPTRATWPWPCARSTRPCETVRPDGAARVIPIADFHRLPGNTPHIETTLQPGELITAVTLPRPSAARRSTARCATGPRMPSRWSRWPPIVQRDGTGRVALGGVAHKPWRVEAAEAEMPRGAEAVADRLLAGARTDPRQRLQGAAGRAHARRRADQARS